MRTSNYRTQPVSDYRVQPLSPPLVRWGAVFSGAVVGLALTLLAGSLWVALAFASHRAVFYNHLAWWFAGTAMAGVFLAAMMAGGVSATRGRSSGLANGLTTWGVFVLGGLAAGIPGVLAYGATRPITVNGIQVAVTTIRPWTTFWSLLIGLGAAVVGGLIGGMLPRRRLVETTIGGVPGETATSSLSQTMPAGPVVTEVPTTP